MTLPVRLFGLIFVLVTHGLTLAREPVKIISDESQLFLDDWIVAESAGLKRVLHNPVKKGLVKEADGSDWQRGSVYASIDSSNVVVRDADGLFHMTYRYMWWDPGVRDLHPSIGEDKAHWFRVSTAYATSKDGIRWHKPALGRADGPISFKKQVEFPFQVPTELSKDNNLGCPVLYLRDLHAHANISDPAKRFLVRMGRPRDTHNFAVIDWQPLSFATELPDFLGKSSTTEKLTPIAGGQLPPRGLLVGYDAQAKLWFAVGQDRFGAWRGRNGRDIARCTSPDLVTWDGPRLVLPIADDESKDPKDWVEYMDLVAYRVGGAQSGAWLGQLVIFHGDRSNPQYLMPGTDNVWRKGTTELRLITSRDAGKTWQRVGGKQVWLPCSPQPHGFDRLVFAATPVEVGDELWFYYPAWDGDHLVFNRDGSLFDPGFLRTARTALATLRRDGYVSLDAGEEPGSLLTTPLRFQGDRLEVNLHAPNGWLRVELTDDDGKPIPGFTITNCIPVRGDGVHLQVQWKDGKELKEFAGKPVRLRFQLRDASLYAFRFVGKMGEPAPWRDKVTVENRNTLTAGEIECERIALGEDDDYKPDLVLMPNGELILVAFHQHKKDGGKVLEQNLLFRSGDGGKTWSKPQKLDQLGREPYLTVLKDGTLFMTGHLLANDVRNKFGYTHGYLHRSTDAGQTWESIRIESEGIQPKASNHSSRNVLQLRDGTLVLGVDYDGGAGPYLLWRSKDNGQTWDKSGKCQPKAFKSQYGFFGGETWLWQAKSGKIWALVRVDSNELPIQGRPIKAGNDQADHFILFSSSDDGRTFDRIHDFGDYGEMYMSLLRLQDKRLLLTFTVRDLKPPLGVRAIPGVETDDGFEFDFTRDRIVLDTRTPIDKSQGGGFGPTVQLKDGTLITSYSYRANDDKTHLEVVRWSLPPARPKSK